MICQSCVRIVRQARANERRLTVHLRRVHNLLHNNTSARATVATFTGCQLRLSTSVGCSSTFATILHFLSGCPSGVEPPPSGSQPDVQKPLHHGRHIYCLPFKNAPTRIRTRNALLEARSDRPFHHRGARTVHERKARDSNPHPDEREPP